jgi:hypothetical protein
MNALLSLNSELVAHSEIKLFLNVKTSYRKPRSSERLRLPSIRESVCVAPPQLPGLSQIGTTVDLSGGCIAPNRAAFSPDGMTVRNHKAQPQCPERLRHDARQSHSPRTAVTSVISSDRTRE